MKGPSGQDEAAQAENAVKLLGEGFRRSRNSLWGK